LGHQFTSVFAIEQQGDHRSGYDPDVFPIRKYESSLTGDFSRPAAWGGVV
jgi:hypothetical protein